MSDLLPLLFLVGALVVVTGFFAWLASHVRRRGTAGAAITAAMASYDEAFRVTAHEAHHEIQAQAGRKVPLLSPDRPWESGSRGVDPARQRRPRRVRPGLRRRFARPWRGRRPGAS